MKAVSKRHTSIVGTIILSSRVPMEFHFCVVEPDWKSKTRILILSCHVVVPEGKKNTRSCRQARSNVFLCHENFEHQKARNLKLSMQSIRQWVELLPGSFSEQTSAVFTRFSEPTKFVHQRKSNVSIIKEGPEPEAVHAVNSTVGRIAPWEL
jgi:hypothetical protein